MVAAKKAAKKSAKKKAAPKRRAAAPKKALAKRAPASGRSPNAKGPAPRADKGEGEAAVQARIKALPEPGRSIVAKLHSLVKKHGPDLEPAVKWGFAVYMRDGKMLLVAAPRKAYVSFGFTMDAEKLGVGKGFVEYKTAGDVDEARVAAWAMLAAAWSA